MKASILFPLLVPATVLAAGGWLMMSPGQAPPRDDPWAHLPSRPDHVSHADFFDPAEFADVKDDLHALSHAVTARCLECHPEEGPEVMQTAHWHWKGDTVHRPGKKEAIRVGKANLINNFCISVQSNLPRCTSCHPGYGWRDDTFDFQDPKNIDCLVCHEQTGTYVKAGPEAGYPKAAPAPEKGQPENPDYKVDYMLGFARSVGVSSRDNCGSCHFSGGGGDAVKHGDLNGFMYQPEEDVDVHMGRHDLRCTDCHRTENHDIRGHSMGVSFEPSRMVRCTDCHDEAPHRQDRLNGHTAAVACTTCHIPKVAKRAPTKMWWDWSKAGYTLDQAREMFGVEDAHDYNPIKGLFRYAEDVTPEYRWYNGFAGRYLRGEVIEDPEAVLSLNPPQGDVRDAGARIVPFKIHRGRQPYDLNLKHLLIPKTFGDDGFWGMTQAQKHDPEWRWHLAFLRGAELHGLPYSGAETGQPAYGWVETEMYWPQVHMVAPAEEALQCNDCHPDHGDVGLLDWEALGYPGDPAAVGGRQKNNLITAPRPWASREGE